VSAETDASIPVSGLRDVDGSSSTGRAPVSKTGGWGFKSLLPCEPTDARTPGGPRSSSVSKACPPPGRVRPAQRRPALVLEHRRVPPDPSEDLSRPPRKRAAP
jgi:hypothetical protein